MKEHSPDKLNKGRDSSGRYRNEKNTLATGGNYTPGNSAGSKTGEQIATTLDPPPSPREERVSPRVSTGKPARR